MTNPLLERWITPFETPPFGEIKTEHFKPAIEKLIALASGEIRSITDNTEKPDFENTVAALDRAGRKLGSATAVLFNLNSAETSKELQKAAQEVSPLLARYSNDITLNKELFSRIRTVYENSGNSGLNTEQKMLLGKTWRSFILGGAGLAEADKSRFREISEELSKLSLKFEENVLDETNDFILHITDENDLASLPEGVKEMAAIDAREKGREGWVFTLQYPSYIPFMQYSDKRELREKLFKAYASRSFRGNEKDNRELAARIVNLRLELAALLGFRNYAEMTLGDRMAENPSKVMNFLEELHKASRLAAERDFSAICEYAKKTGFTGELQRWDWAYFSEKLRKEKFNIDDEVLKPYFVLENVEKAVLGLATRLFGISFRETKSIPLYHPEVRTWEVYDEDGKFLAVFYADYFPRPGKLGGAWMTSYREQRMEGNVNVRPLISIVANFTRPTDTRPSLLTFNEVTTLLHEFGHSLHGMLTNCTYESLSGTSVARDFVELPSQFLENYAFEKEWLSEWATHYKTGEMIPFEYVQKIKDSSTFNEGYACNRQLSFGFLDMAWHSLETPAPADISTFEQAAMAKTELFPAVEGTNMSVSFTHIFGGGYAAGYYGYKWAEVLDADAFSFFKEKGIFDKGIAASYRKNILEKGGTDKPLDLYVKFRGREPSIKAFLERSGLLEER